MPSDREKEIFYAALDLDAASRAAFLDTECEGDEAMRQRIDALQAAHEQAEEFMGAPTIDSHPAEASPAEAELQLGGTIGPYELESTLGEGGFGRVYLARQRQPVARTVALKVLKAGMDSRAIVTRFEAERQALAVMDHPNVARVFDGGQTPSGRPYFVMEYVRGEPITTFCARKKLPIRQRLEIFEQVCLAVQHAHHKGIIHRDLKPTNVLVTTVDDQPAPKVIDFGIAKAIGPQNADATMMTLEGHIIGTPAYMSPEQLAGTTVMDTRSDVYTLGVLLYEVLTGLLPFDATRLENTPLASLAQIICEETPPKPSTRILRAGEEGGTESVAHARQLAARLRSDLDWIIMKALEKEPGRRYQTAFAMASDIRRYLRDEAVEACPPSSVYRLRKFAQRHRGELAAAGLVLVALVGGLVSSLVFAARVDEQRHLTARELEKSQAFAGFSSDMLSGLDPAVARGEDTTLLRQMLADAEDRLTNNPPDSAEVEAEMHELLGTAFYKIADFPKAEEQFTEALDDAVDALGEEHATTLRIRHALGQIYLETTRLDDARRALTQVLEVRTRTLGPDDPLTINAIFDLAVLDRIGGKYETARDTFEGIVEHRSAVLGDRHADTMSARNSLATVLEELGEFERSAELFYEIIEYQRQALGPDHPHTLATQNNLSDTLSSLGRNDEAAVILADVLETKRRVLGPDHPSLIIALNNLASTYKELGRTGEAESFMTEALEIADRTLGPRDMRTLILTNNLAGLMLKTDRPGEARVLLAPAVPICGEVLGAEHPLVLAMLSYLTGIDLGLGEPARAAVTAADLVARADRGLRPDHPDRAKHRRLWGETLLEAGDAAGAEVVLLEAYEMHERGMVRGPADPAKAAALLARACEALGREDDARRWRDLAALPDDTQHPDEGP
jgi:serine/threonine protein kinase/tetratricopeptide (TPR) repeat protein